MRRKYNPSLKDFKKERKNCDGVSALDLMGFIIVALLLVVTMTIAISALIIAESNRSKIDEGTLSGCDLGDMGTLCEIMRNLTGQTP